MSLVNSSVSMLLTARSLQIALKRSPWQPGQPGGHVAAVAAAEHARPGRASQNG